MSAYKYLGVWITSNGEFRTAKRNLSNQGKKALFSLKSALSKLHYLPVTVALKLYDVMIVPILCYGCELWGFHEDKDLERVEDHYLKFVLYLPPNATITAIRGELGQLPIYPSVMEREDFEILEQTLLRGCSSTTQTCNSSSKATT